MAQTTTFLCISNEQTAFQSFSQWQVILRLKSYGRRTCFLILYNLHYLYNSYHHFKLSLI